ncbi:MAG TPA: N,N-dimethylformamidase beta subunit family domain-containing protein [Ignavibacteriales bacterium]|nr:N,N-dimethylformamidase beta subunit family domain-containing protein [Ignavibacteriales bacterium]
MKKFYSFVFILFILSTLSVSAFAQTPDGGDDDTPSNYGCGFIEGGYASDLSAYKGDTLRFYISTHALTYDLKIYRYGKTKELVATIPGCTGGIHEVKASDAVYLNGCKWPESASIVIPQDWKPGAYLAEFPAASDTINPVLFCVKDKNTTNRLLVVCGTNTYQAYNMFGGKSSYPAISSGAGPGIYFNNSEKLSFFRPFNINNYNNVNRGSFKAYDSKLIKWLEEEGYDADVVCDVDLDRDPQYLNKHKVVFTDGHNEYWSRKMRENVEAFVNKGGHYMCLSGNTCWWQIRYENDYHTFVCYKHNYAKDPYYGTPLGSQEWYKIQRENTFLGTSYENGGQVNYGICLLAKEGFGGYIVRNSQHWIFENTGLSEGDTLGYQADSSIVGYETDAALFSFKNGMPVVTGEDQTPLNFRILGLSPANWMSQNSPEEWATMGIFKYKNPGSGYVFNAATVRWVWGLSSHTSKVSLVTKNVLDRFLKNSFPPEFVYWRPYAAKSEDLLRVKMPFNYRKIELQKGKTIRFKVFAADANNEQVSYYWTINDTIVPGSDRIMKFDACQHMDGLNVVKAYAYNSMDTSSISWEVNIINGGVDLQLAGAPSSVFTPGSKYIFMPGVNSRKGTRVHYRIDNIPDWMTYDPNNNIFEGIPPADAPAYDSIMFAAVNNLGDIDAQIYRIRNASVVSPVFEDEASPADYALYQNFPNPFNGMTKIRFYAKNPVDAEVTVMNLEGQEIRSYRLGKVNQGFQEVVWDGRNESGIPVSSGVYFYRVSCSSQGNLIYSTTKKMAYIK